MTTTRAQTAAGPSPARLLTQLLFVAITLWMGWQFHGFVRSLEAAAPDVALRPPGVEAFLPISALMSLVYGVKTGLAQRVHPAGAVLLVLTVVLAVLMRRGFCGWVCPIGTLAEYAHRLGARLFGRNLAMPLWLDRTLRAVKYLLLAFFLIAIGGLSAETLRAFIEGDYNRVADIKMYLFFAQLGRTGLIVILVLLALSVLYQNFWCRYLCPYGALLGLCALPSPVAVRRRAASCTQCGRCTRACPNRIPVQRRARIYSVECTACYDCVQACPEPATLALSLWPRQRPVATWLYAGLTVLAFAGVPRLADRLDYWRADTSAARYRDLFARIETLDHPRGGAFEGR